MSADADPQTGYIVFSDGNWTISGGTSAAAPLWGALAALGNAATACRGFTLGFLNPALYQIAGSSYLSNFSDAASSSPITGAANNDAIGQNNSLYPVTADYDMTTGIGSPIASTLVNSLCSLRAPVYTVSVASPGSQTTTVGNAVSLQISGSDSGSQALSYSATGLPAGLSMSPSGLITGTPTTVGSSTVAVSAGDPYTNSGTTSFTWTVAAPPPPPPPPRPPPAPPAPGRPGVRGASLGGLKNRQPKLSFIATQGSNAPPLKVIKVTVPSGLGFAHKNKSVKKALSVKSGGRSIRFSFSRSGDRLTITLANAASSVSMTIGPSALTESKGLKTTARKRKFKGVKLTVAVIDARLLTTSFPLTLK